MLLVTFLPANIYAAANHIGVGDHKLGPGYLWIRIPLQMFLLLWALWPVFWPEKRSSATEENRIDAMPGRHS